ncbi:MAG: hypothetical protein H7263_10765 [Candidatus Sericytochromatia bacterium]|nr:hypothetical protein [Candidatus Sericytochromatia bacterium]
MDYYVTWTDRDVNYQEYDDNCHMMISPRNVNKSWSSKKWTKFPKKIIIDSGAIQYIKDKRFPSPEDVLNRQLSIFGEDVPSKLLTFCSPDIPLIPYKISKTEALERIKLTIKNAEQYFNLMEKQKLYKNYRFMGVVQAFDPETAYYSSLRLAEIGYETFGIGSLIPLSARGDKQLIFRIIEAVIEAIGTRVHIFGITAPGLISKLKKLKVESIDSSTPMREAINGAIIYSNPFRRCKFLRDTRSQEWTRNYSFGEIIDKLESCICPVCIEDPDRLLLGGQKKNINWKAIHNYFHLKWEIQNEIIEKEIL